MRYFVAGFLVILLLAFLFAPLPCLADGYVTVVKSIGKLPGIPEQRGIVQFRDGLETLVVETSFEAEGHRFGWVVPVPSVPTKFRRFSSGIFDALSLQIQPEIVRLNSTEVVNWIMLAALFSLILFRFVLKALRFKTYDLGLRLLIAFPFLYFMGQMAAGLFGEYRRGASFSVLGVKVVGRQTVGNYDISVIEARDSTGLNRWLEENDFITLSPNAKRIVQSYIDDNWYFVSARLTARGGDRAKKTHPVLMEFQADRPVYPMRLTSIAGSDLSLEVYVISDKEAIPEDYALEKEFCAPIHLMAKPLDRNDRWNGSEPKQFFYPEAREVMWDGCVLSKYSGAISSKDMKSDLEFRFGDSADSLKPFRRTYWDYRAAMFLASIFTLLTAATIYTLLNTKWGKRRVTGMSIRLLFWSALPIVFTASYFAFGNRMNMEQVKKVYCNESVTHADVMSAYYAAHDFFGMHPSKFPSLEDLQNNGFSKSSECVEFQIGGKSREDFSITGFLLNGTGWIQIDATGSISANGKKEGSIPLPILPNQQRTR